METASPTLPWMLFLLLGDDAGRALVERPLRVYRPLLSSLAVQWKLWAGPDDQARVL